MRLTDRVALVGSGKFGFSMTNDFDCHVYLLDGGSELAMIDAGVGLETDRILENVSRDGFDPARITKVLLTHAHADHCGGSAVWNTSLNAVVALHDAETAFLECADEEQTGLRLARSGGWYPEDYRLTACEVGLKLQHGQELSVGELKVRALHVPGHSRGSVCYAVSDARTACLFTGDTVFLNGEIGLLNCVGSTLADYRDHIHRLSELAVDCVFPGHRAVILSKGQRHLDRAIKNLKGLVPPENLF